jgi:6-phosphofructokinase 1
MIKRIALLTSGGDAPGMNAAIRAATLVGLERGLEVLGVRHGYRGLLDGEIAPLTATRVARIIREGGTMLGSARCPEFTEKSGRDKARMILEQRGIEGLIVIGGNGSLTGLTLLSDPEEVGGELSTRVVGIPASIDNDVGLTSLAIGADTAINTIVEACDKISDTASAHDRTFIVEVMGRDCGYLAMASGIASSADAILFPEQESTEERVVSSVVSTIERALARPEGRAKHVLIIKAEGLGISAEALKNRVDERLTDEKGRVRSETRVTVLGHVVRGGRPTAADRLLASRMGNGAVRTILEGGTRKMVGFSPPADLPKEIGSRPSYDPQLCIVGLEAMLQETQRLLDGTSPVTQRRAQMFREISDVLSLG